MNRKRSIMVAVGFLLILGVGFEESRLIGQNVPFEGYNLFSPLNSTTAYLMDNNGNFVHTWNTNYKPGNAVYLLDNGELLRTGKVVNTTFDAGGAGGIVQSINWDGHVTWSYEYSSAKHLQHHDVEKLPNGNVLLVAWQYKPEEEAIAAGRNPLLLEDGELWPDSIIEVQPTGASAGRIVWEWHIWDHLIQDYDPTQDNNGVVAEHPELINLNYVKRKGGADWTHINSVDYNAELDQIVLSVHSFSEIWVIDHSTSTAEAAGHTGGNSGKGGDLLYRWGNPQAYDAGTSGDQQLFAQHDAEWIEKGIPGEGNIIIFNNGQRRPEVNYSSVDEIVPTVNLDGSYSLIPGSKYGPEGPFWTYTADIPTDFFAQNISGQQRLPNGNTLICDGPSSYFFEVTAEGEKVWEYTHKGSNAVFRVERYVPDFPGFDGTPLDKDPSNQNPIADAGGPYSGTLGTTITLNGSGSKDSDGTITSYAWDLDHDGQYDDFTGVTANFVAKTAGTFSVGLRVTDNDGLSDTDTATVNVTVGGNAMRAYSVVDTGQATFYNNTSTISEPTEGAAFYGQDAQFEGNQPSYTISSDGLTVFDNVTGLTWTQGADWNGDGTVDASDKFTFAECGTYVDTLNAQNYGGYSDWRVPTIKELYSLIDFRGTDPNPQATNSSGLVPFINDDVFEFGYGDTSSGERIIDSQWATSTLYVGTVMKGTKAMFGVNFADGRIKGYPAFGRQNGVDKIYYVRYCRGNMDYGKNDFTDNGDGTVTDNATGLMWSKSDSGAALNWEDALTGVQQKNQENYLGYKDWRLPNAKELQSIVDYTRSPDTTNSAAIDPVFSVTEITNEGGKSDFAFYWTGTTHASFQNYRSAVYIAFGRGLGWMQAQSGDYQLLDVHGAGAQRSDPKMGDPNDFPYGRGPQGDVIRIYNYVRCVRGTTQQKSWRTKKGNQRR